MQITNVTIRMLQGKTLIEKLNLSINPGDKLAIIGEEGNGKSTLLKAIYDVSLLEGYASISGMIDSQGQKVGYLPQQVPLSVDQQGAYAYLSNPYLEKGLYDQIAMIEYYGSKFGLRKDIFEEDRPIFTLSGGEKIKVELIGLLLEQNDILLLDEPSNDLDIETLKWLETFIQERKEAIVFISHDETLLRKCANRIIHLEMLKKKQEACYHIANMDYITYQEKFHRDYENQLSTALLERREKENKEQVLRKLHSKVEYRLNQAVRDPTQGRLLAKKMKVIKSQEKKVQDKELTKIPEAESAIQISLPTMKTRIHPNYQLLHLENYTIQIGEKVLAKNLNFTIIGAKKIGIIGKNGVGKTTLLKSLLEMLKAKEGIRVGYLPQNYQEKLPSTVTPIAYLQAEFGLDKEMETKIRSYLGALKFTHEEMLATIKELSGGQKCKLLIAELLLQDNDVLVLDEPTRNLSPLTLPKIRELFCSFPGAILSVSHDRQYLREVMDEIVELRSDGFVVVAKELLM